MTVKVKVNEQVVNTAMARANLSQSALARRLGINKSYLCQILQGKRYVSPWIRKALLEILPDLTFEDSFILCNVSKKKRGGKRGRYNLENFDIDTEYEV